MADCLMGVETEYAITSMRALTATILFMDRFPSAAADPDRCSAPR